MKMKRLAALLLTGCMLASALPVYAAEMLPDVEEVTGEDAPLADTQEITYVLSNEPDGIDPGITNNSFASIFLVNCFEGLSTYDSDGNVVPGVAESWDISEDGKVYTFHLREGLKWSDGSPLTANDFVYSYKRVLDPATGAQYVNMLTDYVVGAAELYAGEGSEEDLGIKALDDQTLEITLMQPASWFIDMLTMWVWDPVQEATITANGDQWTNSPDTYICNGPFVISDMSMGEYMVLSKNENYWDAENVTLDKVTLRYVLDTATALSAYESGEVDGINTIPASDVARLKAEGAGVQTAANFGTTYYLMNCTKAPYDNPLVRKALNLAIDRQAIIDNVMQVEATPAYNLIGPGYIVDGVDFSDGDSNWDLSATADVEAAQAALAEAGYPNGEGFPTMQLSYYSSDTVKKVVEALAEMFETNLGIDVEITSADWAVFYEDVQAGNYEVAAMGWSADYLHPMSFLPLLKTDDVSNTSFYSNPDYDALVEQVMTETDPVKGWDLMKQAEALAMEDYPLLNLFYKSSNYAMKDHVTGYFMNASSSLFLKGAKVIAVE